MYLYADEFIGTLDDESQKRAKKELNEDEKNRAGAVETLREWAKQQPWLKTRTGLIPSFYQLIVYWIELKYVHVSHKSW
jgi:hypothetical protein